VPLADGARRLRAALAAAVQARTPAGAIVSCDLSGGLDSTSVCLLAARSPVELIAYTATGLDPGDDDVQWALRAIGALRNVRHEILPRDEMPLVYQGIATADDQLDEPFIGVIDRAQLLTAFNRLAPLGPRVHLTGFGGDEVLESEPSHLRSLIRTHPWTALAQLRGHRAQARWPRWLTTWMLLRPRSYRSWLSETAARLTNPRHSPRYPSLDWDEQPRLPPWVTPDAVALVRQAMEAVRDSARPLGGTWGQHSNLLAIRSSARIVRSFAQMVAPTGLPLAAPLLDDQVIEACLAVRAHERTTPWQYKP